MENGLYLSLYRLGCCYSQIGIGKQEKAALAPRSFVKPCKLWCSPCTVCKTVQIMVFFVKTLV